MEITTSKTEQALVVSMEGRLDAVSSPAAQEQLLALIDKGEHFLVMDLKALDYISSAGFRLFMMVIKRLNACNGKMALFGLQDHIKELFEIAGFNTLFPILSSEEEALGAVQ